MSAGLQKILEKIATDPSNKVLIKRFISLVKEMTSDADKSRQMIGLAKTIVEADPIEAMQLAYMVFEYDRFSTEALEVVANCLKNLGRSGKSEVVRNEIRKLQELKRAQHVAFEKDGKALNTDHSNINTDTIEERISSNLNQVGPTVAVPTGKAAALLHNAPPPGPLRRDTEQRNTQITTGRRLTDPLDNPLSKSAVNNSPKALPPQNMQIAKSPPANVKAIFKPAAPAPKPESKSLSTPAPDNSVRLRINENTSPRLAVAPGSVPVTKDGAMMQELFDFYYRGGQINEAKEILVKASESERESWWQARKFLIDQTSQKGDAAAPNSNHAKTDETSSFNSKKSKAQEWGEQLDEYMSQGRHRKALSQIIARVQPDQSMEWALEAWKRLPTIWQRLSLQAFEWRASLGVKDLHKKLSKRLPPKLSTVMAFSQRKRAD